MDKIPYEEFKQQVLDECSEYGIVQARPDDFKKVWEEEQESIRRYYEKGKSPASVAWGLSLLV